MTIFVPGGPYSSVSIVTGLRSGRPSLIPGRGSKHLRYGVETSFDVRRSYRSPGGRVAWYNDWGVELAIQL
jgi:hypothetical protein